MILPPESGDERAVADAVLEAAIAWQLLLSSGQADDGAKADFKRWLKEKPEHARAWRQLESIDGSLRTLAPLRKVLSRPRRRVAARALLGAIVVLAALGSGLLAMERRMPWQAVLADRYTQTGERRVLTLPDGSELALNSRTAIDIDFDWTHRVIRLRSGEISIRTAGGDPRPFVVVTPHGMLRALGTHFLVRLEPSYTLLTVLESAVLARPAVCTEDLELPCEAEHRVMAGEGGRIAPDSVEPVVAVPEHADAWVKGMLVVEDVPMQAVVAELQRHERIWLSVAPEVANLRVTGAVPLDQPMRALEALTHALPVQVTRRTGLWLHVERR